MRRILGKLKNKKGESMAEMLVAITVAMLALVYLAAAINMTIKVNAETKIADRKSYIDISETSKSGEGNIRIGTYTDNIDVDLYTDEQGRVYFYKEATP